MPKVGVPYKPPVRNYDGVPFQKIREKIDPYYCDVHDMVSIAYYDYWRKGLSHPIQIGGKTYDVQATVEESRRLMNKLIDLAWRKRQVLFHEVNMALPAGKEQFSEEAYRYRRDEKGEVEFDEIQAAQDKITEYESRGMTLDYGVDSLTIAGGIK